MNKQRKGRQTPTVWHTLPYTETKANDCISLYEETKRTAQEWQRNLMSDILAVNDEGLWMHTKYGYSVPRRNGKNEIVAMREMYALENGERVLHTAHRVTTSSEASRRLASLLVSAGYTEVQRVKQGEKYDKHFTYAKQVGAEKITLLGESKGFCSFRTRTSKGGLGEGFDLLVIDEAQEYTGDQETSLKYVVTDSQNPQTLFCGTPPTAVSSGEVFKEFRDSVINGNTRNAGWAEWSVNEQTDVNDVDAWYECNPSLGTTLTERAVADEVGSDILDFNIQRLGLWISYNLASAISAKDWQNTEVKKRPKLKGKLFVGIKYGNSGVTTAMSIACKTDDDNIFVSVYDCRNRIEGDEWILSFLESSTAIEGIIADGKVGVVDLGKQIKQRQIGRLKEVSSVDFLRASSLFEWAVFNKGLVHMEQPALDSIVTNCEKKPYGKSGGFVYTSLANEDTCIMDSFMLAYFLAKEHKERKAQRIQY